MPRLQSIYKRDAHKVAPPTPTEIRGGKAFSAFDWTARTFSSSSGLARHGADRERTTRLQGRLTVTHAFSLKISDSLTKKEGVSNSTVVIAMLYLRGQWFAPIARAAASTREIV